ncbi:MAG: hypothetical protein FWC81_02860 [Coriobacteriia bacterium]|nr:hypothetical protein [Coriobacteriia bacterium]MCL2606050.1 hypothetical protein [Coriobacteriia bacterium]
MSSDLKRVFIVLAFVLIIGLAVASVAVAQSHLEQRRCYEAGCLMWQNCSGDGNCPRNLQPGMAPGAGSGCDCC